MKTHVLIVSRNFPATHVLKGKPTEFFEKILSKEKKHTIRGNYAFWKKRIDEVNQGIAVLSVRQWSAKPYCSPQHELIRFSQGMVGVQKLSMDIKNFTLSYLIDNAHSVLNTHVLANNDGLSKDEFVQWFKQVKHHDQLAIIHFTSFRY